MSSASARRSRLVSQPPTRDRRDLAQRAQWVQRGKDHRRRAPAPPCEASASSGITSSSSSSHGCAKVNPSRENSCRHLRRRRQILRRALPSTNAIACSSNAVAVACVASMRANLIKSHFSRNRASSSRSASLKRRTAKSPRETPAKSAACAGSPKFAVPMKVRSTSDTAMLNSYGAISRHALRSFFELAQRDRARRRRRRRGPVPTQRTISQTDQPRPAAAATPQAVATIHSGYGNTSIGGAMSRIVSASAPSARMCCGEKHCRDHRICSRRSRVLKKFAQRRHVILIGPQRDRIDPLRRKSRSRSARALLDRVHVGRTRARGRSIDLDLLAGLRVFQRDQPDIRQFLLARIDDRDRDQVVPPAGHRELA